MIRLMSSLSALGFLLVGILIGAFFFMDTQPRSLIPVRPCDRCLVHAELLGLIGSVIVQKTPRILPIVLETDFNVVIEHPLKKEELHFVVIPKKDIKSAGDFSAGDEPYITDAFAIMRNLIEEHHMDKYRIVTNGPGYQQVNYLHFHLTGIPDES